MHLLIALLLAVWQKNQITVEFDQRQLSRSTMLPYTTCDELYFSCASTQQLRTLVISPSDWAGEEKSRKKNRYKFFVQRPDGKYLFRVSLQWYVTQLKS